MARTGVGIWSGVPAPEWSGVGRHALEWEFGVGCPHRSGAGLGGTHWSGNSGWGARTGVVQGWVALTHHTPAAHAESEAGDVIAF